MPNRLSITVLISGGGTTLKNLIWYQEQGWLDANIHEVISSSKSARGLQYAEEAGVNASVVSPHDYVGVPQFSSVIFERCRESKSDLIVMGGFLKRLDIPGDFCNRVINIHPSLIPAFCGKGLYGVHVHRAVLEYGCKISGCTVHFVDDQYDHGPIIAQRTVAVREDDTAELLAQRVFEQECELYPQVINWIAAGKITVRGRHVSVTSLPLAK